MSTDSLKITAGFGLLIIISLVVIQGCGELTGEISTNQAPLVEFVNVPTDAFGADTTHHYGMPFDVADYDQDVTILNMQGALMVEGSDQVYALSGDEIPIRTDFIRDQDYTMDYQVFTGSDTVAVLQALSGGAMTPGNTYYIDFSFTISNYYVVSSAPTVYWKGEDADGFVEYYRYADVSDPVFIDNFRNDPGYYYDHFSELTWVDTTAMSARIYLLTEAGDTTEHVVFLKAVDDLNKESEGLIFKTFYRTNNPPNNPEIKLLESAETEYALNNVLEDTLFSLPELTPLWSGISFNWRADDPDDKELYQIPLEFTYYLIKTPGDTLWDQSDKEWSETSQIQLYGLETGSYIFSVWVRDDGLTISEEPATISFNLIQPTWEYHILLVDETANNGIFELPNASGEDLITDFYLDILSEIEGTLENDNYVMDGVDVRYKDNSDFNPLSSCPIPMALISQYKLVILYGDDENGPTGTIYKDNRNALLADYLDVGGQVWYIGRRVLVGEFGLSAATTQQDDPVTGFLADYMQILTGYGSNLLTTTQSAEFSGALPVITSSLTESFPAISVDSAKVEMLGISAFNPDPTLFKEVDWFTRTDEAQTMYVFNSSTADTIKTSPYIYSENSTVQPGATQEQCIVVTDEEGILDVYRVENVTKGVLGDVVQWNATQIWVSYQGEPWTPNDELLVDYKYDPVSNSHLKPVAVRYEAQPRIQNQIEINGFIVSYYTFELGYRTSLFGFPLSLMDNSSGEVTELMRTMLDWFFYPEIHWDI